MSEPKPQTPAWRSLLAGAVLLALAWYLREALLLIFGAVLVAATLLALAGPLVRTGKFSRRAAVALVMVVLTGLVVGAVWAVGEPLGEQLALLGADVPRAWESLRVWLESSVTGARLLGQLRELPIELLPLSGIAEATGVTLQALSAMVLMVLMGAYLAFDVGVYVRGVVRLFPVPQRARVEGALDAAGDALSRWLIGQGVTMVAVGVAVAAGLSLLGMPLALALGLIAAVLEFVPFFGPIVSGLLAVLVAFAQGPQMALYVALLFLAVQQLEGNVLVPLVQRWAVKLPPLLSVAAVVVFSTLFGIPGIVFGTPLMVVTMVLVRRLWVEQALEGKPY